MMRNENLVSAIIADTNKNIGISSVGLFGKPGTGKTYFAEKILAPAFLQGQGEILFYQCHEGTGKEELLYDLDIRGVVEKLSGDKNSSSYLQKGIILNALEKSKNGKIIIILDELDKARPQVDGFLLDVIQNCRVYDPAFGLIQGKSENLILVITSNQDREFSLALLRRLRRIIFQFPQLEEELRILESMGVSVPIRFQKFLISVANYYRSQETIKSISSWELARICFDLQEGFLTLEGFLNWFSPYQEDQAVILKKFPAEYLQGIIKGGMKE